MAFNYPYGDTQQLNLNWFLSQWETFREQWATAEEGIDHALDAEIARVEAAMTDLYAARDAAAASKTAAQTAATNAASSETVATQQATLAQSYANTAQTQAGIATAAAEAAGNSASSASTSATAANLSKTQAANSATAAQTAQTAAAGSASNAADSATAAAGSASNAADSATAASGSASSAADSATAAAASAASLVVDSAMSDSSTNPVQNKVINGELTELKTAFTQIEKQMDGTRNIQVEIGSMSAGKPSVSTAYVRSKDFIKANKGDVLTLSPKAFGLYYGCVYLYSTDDESGYTTDFDIPTVSANSTWTHTFTADCYFMFRASNASSGALITPADLYEFDSVFTLSHLYNIDEVFTEKGSLAIDYDTLNTSLSGKFNLAIQTDTHMSDYVGYSSSVYPKSDFGKLQTIVNSINKIDVDVFANLGDFIRGYQFDTDFENRATIDKMINCYADINTYKAYVIGNHDDGCMFYNNTDFNDNPLTSNVLFPTEQFNRITKFGINNKGKSNYYYEDVNGVRIITLYQRDFDYSAAVPQIESFKIGSEQISWFTNTALDTELPVIILTHAPLVSSLYATSRVGFDDILTAINGFVSNGGTVIAVLSGHTHSQATAKVDGINHIVFDDGYTWFDLVSVDLTNKTISCKAINNTSVQDLNLTY